jgi:Protein of unknown function (DUF3551)
MGNAMRDLTRLVVGTVIVFAASPAAAQRYDPAYPVCMEIADGEGSRIECFFTSMEQCKEGAKGMPGSCFNNPTYKPPPAEVTPAVAPASAPSPIPMKKKKKG